MEDRESFNPADYPSIGPAFELVVPSYDWALRRLDAIERRLDNLARFVITVTFAAPAGTVGIARLSGNPVEVIYDESLWIVIASFASTLLLWVIVRQIGTVKVIDLQAIFNKYLAHSKEEFRKDIIYAAGEHAIANERLSRRKSLGANLMAVLFGVEVVALLIWSLSVLSQ